MDFHKNTVSITSLPDEIIALILQNNTCLEIIRFGCTCKQFYELVHNYQSLWKDKLKDVLPKDIYDVCSNNTGNNWLEELKKFCTIKNRIYTELTLMSPKYYWNRNEINFLESSVFFNIALTNNLSYYYTIYVLQELIRKAYQNIKEFKTVKPYTLTEIYYAKVILRHLLNTYLTVKWVQGHIKNELHPEFVVNFFVQWVDSLNLHLQEEVDTIISNLVMKVENILVKQSSTDCVPGKKVKDMCSTGQISERQVLAAVTQVLYRQPHMAFTDTANLDTLDIVKVMTNKCGYLLVLGAIYQAVARHCGVYCNLVAFPNHLFLEWCESGDGRFSQKFKIGLGNGLVEPRRGCPFSGNFVGSDYRYSPDSLLQFLVTAFNNTMGAINNWYVQNASYLIEFVHTDPSNFNIYNNFFKLLLSQDHLPIVATPIDLKNFNEMNRQVIFMLNQYAEFFYSKTPMKKEMIVRKRDGRVKYAVGMVCYNRRSEYVCIICGWDLCCVSQWRQLSEISNLQYGFEQPFYHVVAADQSKRYVAQENLVEILQPTRLYHLEDIIASEFTHFNGFYYVPNDQKLLEYPEDNVYAAVFQNHADVRVRPREYSST